MANIGQGEDPDQPVPEMIKSRAEMNRIAGELKKLRVLSAKKLSWKLEQMDQPLWNHIVKPIGQ